MNLYKSLKFISNHPLNKNRKLKSIFRFFAWQFYSRIFKPTYIHQFTPRVKLIVRKGMAGATGNLYCGLHEFNDMSFLLHFLRKEDTFLDIGANIGSYTLLASGHVGAQSISFEPFPKTFKVLKQNIELNELSTKVTAYNMALADKVGTLAFTSGLDTMNHIATSNEQNVIEVQVSTLDTILTEAQVPTLIKIDVEGFETAVIQGAKKTLQNENIKAVIIELNGSGERYGYNEGDIHNELVRKGFLPYQYLPFKRELIKLKSWGRANTIYIRDWYFVLERIKDAQKLKIHNIRF